MELSLSFSQPELPPLPPPAIDHLAELSVEVNTAFAETAPIETTETGYSDTNQNEGLMSVSSSEAEEENTDIQALRSQGTIRLEHELNQILPRLHGLSLLLEDADHFELNASTLAKIAELKSIFTKINDASTMAANKHVNQVSLFLSIHTLST